MGSCRLLLFAAWLSASWLPLRASDAQPAVGAPQLLLLENGGVLRGEVRLIGGFYELTTDGGEIRLVEDQVRFVESSLEQIVERLRAEQPAPTIEDRMRLAAWCARQQLWNHAAQELIAAQRQAPGDRRVVLAQRRLWHARELALQAEQPQPTESRQPTPRRDEAVRPASYAQPADAPVFSDAPVHSDSHSHSGEPSLPPMSAEALQEFTRRVQPILVNNCTTAGCHAVGGEQAFQLNRDLLHDLASRRSTRANLDAVVRALRADDPQSSPLLLAMQPSHAGGRGPRRSRRWAEHQTRVAAWVDLVVGREEEPIASPVGSDRVEIPQAAEPPTDVYAPGYYEALLQHPDQASKGQQPGAETPKPKVRRGVKLKPVRERDEFDPAIFNERFGAPQPEPKGRQGRSR